MVERRTQLRGTLASRLQVYSMDGRGPKAIWLYCTYDGRNSAMAGWWVEWGFVVLQGSDEEWLLSSRKATNHLRLHCGPSDVHTLG